MAKYEVILVRTVQQSMLVTVEADDEQMAAYVAEDAANDGDRSRWEEQQELDFQVDSVELVEPRFETQAQRDVDGAWMDNLGESPDF